jgi:hypothetical protein
MLANRLLKLGSRKNSQNLRKNTAYSTHGGKLLLIEIDLLENLNLNLAGFPPPAKTLIWTSVKFSRPYGTEFGNPGSHADSKARLGLSSECTG